MRRLSMLTALVGAAIAALTTPPAASASTVGQYGDCGKYAEGPCFHRLSFAGLDEERNRVTVTYSPTALTIRDLAGIEADRGCAQVDELTASCPLEPGFGVTARFDLGRGNDFLDARGALAKRIDGGRGDDRLFGPQEVGTTFVSGPGDDLMVGGAGGDRFTAGPKRDGSDTLIGGAQTKPFDGAWYTVLPDRVEYPRLHPVRIDLTGGRDDGERGERDMVTGMEFVETGEADDVIIGGPASEQLVGARGRDVLRGGGGADDLDAGDQARSSLFPPRGRDDVLDGGAGPDVLDAGAGADRLVGGPGRDQLDGGRDRDRIVSASRRADTDWVMCGEEADRLRADRADFVMDDCERSTGAGLPKAGVVAASLSDDMLQVQVGCGTGVDCTGRVRLVLAGTTLATSPFSVLPHSVEEVRLFLSRPGAGEYLPPLGKARLAIGSRRVRLSALPVYRLTASLIGVR